MYFTFGLSSCFLPKSNFCWLRVRIPELFFSTSRSFPLFVPRFLLVSHFPTLTERPQIFSNYRHARATKKKNLDNLYFPRIARFRRASRESAKNHMHKVVWRIFVTETPATEKNSDIFNIVLAFFSTKTWLQIPGQEKITKLMHSLSQNSSKRKQKKKHITKT